MDFTSTEKKTTVKSKKKRLTFNVVDEKALQRRRPGQAGRRET